MTGTGTRPMRLGSPKRGFNASTTAAWRGQAQRGGVIVLYPDEVHDGHAGAPTGFVYSMLYVDPSLIAAALRGSALPFCGEPVFDDPALRRVLANAFVDFPQPIEDLALPTLVTALAEALSRHARALPPAFGRA